MKRVGDFFDVLHHALIGSMNFSNNKVPLSISSLC